MMKIGVGNKKLQAATFGLQRSQRAKKFTN